ncbi:MAG TPA: HAD hydrolase-like protein, partial [Herpetosiphonaceae bacterium]|nr:HAD hydrolase-like protein [Herpetosiphonaceae bacterium]
WLVGDAAGDLRAGRAAGCRTILVRTGYGAALERQLAEDASAARPDLIVAALPEAVAHILATTSADENAYATEDP